MDWLTREIDSPSPDSPQPGLSADHRAVLLECYYRGHSVAEAAHRLGIPEGTVKSRTHYALRALRLTLEEMGVGSR